MLFHFDVKKHTLSIFLFTALALFTAVSCQANDSLPSRTWNVNDTTREALVYIPKSTTSEPMPLLFAFHGHGGTAERVARVWDYQKLWTQAIVVYMQGLKTPGQITDPTGKRTGWQRTIGDQNDRDLQFFDAVLASLKKEYNIDENRIYATGHSNGGSFTYLLWEARPKIFAAFAPSASVARSLVINNKNYVPKPVFVIAGKNDALVKFAWQQKMMDMLRKLNECAKGKSWDIDNRITLYDSSTNSVVATYIYPGGHAIPQDAPSLVVKFFQQHVR